MIWKNIQRIGYLPKLLLGILSLGLSVEVAFAGAFAIREQSATSQGTSYSDAATCGTGKSISSMYFNPAGVTCADSKSVTESVNSLILPKSEITTNNAGTNPFTIGLGSPGDIGVDAFVGASYGATRLTDNVFLGLAVNAPFGLRTKADVPHAGVFYAATSEVFSLNFNPIIGFNWGDKFSFGAGLQAQYFDVRLTQAIPGLPGVPAAAVGGIELKAEDWGFGFTLGGMFRPFEGTEVGIGFRSGIKHTLDGALRGPVGFFAGNPALAPLALTNSTGLTTEAKIRLPEILTLSLSQEVTDALTLSASYEWTNWSVFDTFDVTSPQTATGATGITLPFEYNDGHFFAVGAEFQAMEKLALRAGIGYEISPIDNSNRAIRLPDDDRLWLSAGATYDPTDYLSFTGAYSFLTTFDTSINITPSNPIFNASAFAGTYSGSVDASVHILSVSAKVKLDKVPFLKGLLDNGKDSLL